MVYTAHLWYFPYSFHGFSFYLYKHLNECLVHPWVVLRILNMSSLLLLSPMRCLFLGLFPTILPYYGNMAPRTAGNDEKNKKRKHTSMTLALNDVTQALDFPQSTVQTIQANKKIKKTWPGFPKQLKANYYQCTVIESLEEC